MKPERILDLPSGDLAIVRRVLSTHVPGRPVYAFGCRTRGRARRRSDLDLAIGGSERLSLSVLADLKDEFSESDLPIFVDILDLHDVAEGFLKIIEPGFVAVHTGDE